MELMNCKEEEKKEVNISPCFFLLEKFRKNGQQKIKIKNEGNWNCLQ